MSKRPAFQFYPNDWIRDTIELSLAARGAWITLLSKMWYAEEQGKLTMPLDQFARMFGTDIDETRCVIDEIIDARICDTVTDCHKNVTLINRRMHREFTERESAKNRQKQARKRREVEKPTTDNDDVTEMSRQCHENVTAYSSSSTSSSSSSSSSSSDLKRLIEGAIASNPDVDERLVEIAVLETMIRRKGSWNEHQPIRSPNYFAEEIGNMKRVKLSTDTVDIRLAKRRLDIQKMEAHAQ